MFTNSTDEQLQARVKLLNEHLEAENSHDIEAILNTYGPDPTVVINGHVFSGIESIRKFHERLGFGQNGSFSDLRVDERHRYINDDAIVIEQMLSGRHTGTWQGIAATGHRFEIPVCTIYSFDEGNRLAGERVYFDSAALLKQLGVVE